jgi:cobalt-zinc-cadmium efflux system protein
MGLGHHHGHDHDHDHHGHSHAHAHSRKGERGKLLIAVALTAGILVAEIIGGLKSRSLSLLSDAGHVMSDLVAQLLALVAVTLAARPADARRTYGWHRLEILAALMNGMILFGLAAVLMWQGAMRLRSPVEVHTGLMLVIAVIGLAANLIGAWLLHGSQSLNARGAYLHLVLDALSSVTVVIGGVAMMVAHGIYWLDPLLSMVIGLIIIYNAYRLVKEAVDILLEAVPRDIDPAGVSDAIKRVEGVAEVHDLHIWTITSGMIALSAHVVIASAHEGDRAAIMNRVKHVLIADFKISHTTIQIEEDDHEHVGHVCAS